MTDRYESPFSTRYASAEMQRLFSADYKFRTWRRLWILLAKAEKELGLPIAQEQIDELERYRDDINYDVAIQREKECRHDVMSHVYAYGVQCQSAAGIIHLGATSCYVGDNTDILIMREALRLIANKLAGVIGLLGDFAAHYADMPALAYTHLQPAQPTTVGKRAALWASEFVMDMQELEHRLSTLRPLGCKGATGTQASFLDLFGGDKDKVRALDEIIARELGFPGSAPVSGQTYSRKVDAQVLAALSGVAQSASKFSYDMRLLQSFQEMEEPFEPEQIGSSAMPYKRNPMRCERITALARHVITNSLNPAFTAATQWFERTLDDSANKRIAVAEAFLATDAILELLLNVCDGLVVYPSMVRRRLLRELPFMATENIMMSAVKRGGNRQELHERLREHSLAAGRAVKEAGLDNDLIARVCADPAFGLEAEEAEALLAPEAYTGIAGEQVRGFLREVVQPLLARYPDRPAGMARLTV